MLSGSIAHDFNNVLHALGVMLEFMETEDDAEKIAQIYEDMRYALKRGDDMATQLLAFSRSQQGKVEEVDLCEVLQRTLDLDLKGSDMTRTLHT